MSRKSIILAFVVCTFALVQGRVEAQTKDFKIIGAGNGPHGLPLPGQPARPHWAIGLATGLDFYFGQGTVQTDSAELDQNTGKIVGQFGSGSPFVFTGSNGDELVCWYGRTDHGATQPGTFTLTILEIQSDGSLVVEAAWVAQFVAVPNQCTGQFAGVTGSWVMYAYSAPFVLGSSDPVDYWWHGEGTLTFAHGHGH
jgi:hypothetical protein